MRRIDGIEGLRGLAASCVVLFHVWLYQTDVGRRPLGHHLDGIVRHFWLGVTLFFVLSGFLLYRPFVHATLHGSEPVDLRRYFRARALRIVPGYWAALTITLVWLRPDLDSSVLTVLALAGMLFGSRLVVAQRRAVADRLFGGLLIVMALAWVAVALPGVLGDPRRNWDLLYVVRNYLLLYAKQSSWVIVPAWTLSIEVAFYLCLPFIARISDLLARKGRDERQRAVRQTPLLIGLVSIAFAYHVIDRVRGLPILLPGYLDLFAAGMALAIAYELRPTARSRWHSAGIYLLAAATLGAALSIEQSSTWGVLYQPLTGVSFALVVGVVAMPALGRSRLRALLSTRPLVGLGTVSYGIYVWHWPIVGDVFNGGFASLRSHSYLPTALVVLSLAIAAGAASWLLLEKHMLRLKAPGVSFGGKPAERIPAGEPAAA